MIEYCEKCELRKAVAWVRIKWVTVPLCDECEREINKEGIWKIKTLIK